MLSTPGISSFSIVQRLYVAKSPCFLGYGMLIEVPAEKFKKAPRTSKDLVVPNLEGTRFRLFFFLIRGCIFP